MQSAEPAKAGARSIRRSNGPDDYLTGRVWRVLPPLPGAAQRYRSVRQTIQGFGVTLVFHLAVGFAIFVEATHISSIGLFLEIRLTSILCAVDELICVFHLPNAYTVSIIFSRVCPVSLAILFHCFGVCCPCCQGQRSNAG